MLKRMIVAVLMVVSTCGFAVEPTSERTLSIIKPDAVKDHHIGSIIHRFEKEKLHPVAIKMVRLTQQQAEQFYAEHQSRPFYRDLVAFMTSGPVVVMVLEGPDAVQKNRTIMGATDPNKAEVGTLRRTFAKSMSYNAVHGSDSPTSAAREISFFFKPDEIYSN